MSETKTDTCTLYEIHGADWLAFATRRRKELIEAGRYVSARRYARAFGSSRLCDLEGDDAGA